MVAEEALAVETAEASEAAAEEASEEVAAEAATKLKFAFEKNCPARGGFLFWWLIYKHGYYITYYRCFDKFILIKENKIMIRKASKEQRGGGWPWKLIVCLPSWILKIRLIILKRCEQTLDVKDEIVDCEFQLTYIFFRKACRKSDKNRI